MQSHVDIVVCNINKWWFDLEDVNGDSVLSVPAYSGSRGNYKPRK
jgi:hypothetical protein